MYIPQSIVDAVREDNIINPRSELPKEKVKSKKIKQSSLAGKHDKVEVKANSKSQLVKEVKEYKKPKPVEKKVEEKPHFIPSPTKWRTRNVPGSTNGASIMWAYRRNYKIEIIDTKTGAYPYKVFEFSDPKKAKLVLGVKETQFTSLDQAKQRVEKIARILARGLELRLTDHELKHAEYHPENIQFIEYSQVNPVTPKVTETERMTEAQHERELKEKLNKMNLG